MEMIKPPWRRLALRARYVLLTLTYFGCALARNHIPDSASVAAGIERVIFGAAGLDILRMALQWLHQRWVTLRQRWKAFEQLTDAARNPGPGVPNTSEETIGATDVSNPV